MKITKITSILFIIFLMTTKSFSEEKPKVSSEKYGDWFLECRTVNKVENCELNQLLSLNNTNIRFNLLYSVFKNQENKIREVFTIVTPLGVNLSVSPALRFDSGKQYNFRYIKCEAFGCVISLTNNTTNKENNDLFDEFIKKLIKSKELEIAVQGFEEKPFIVKTSLKGFSKGLTQLQKKASKS